jgi:redox-sensitive bicupin YhaK (pirin superfamily)
MFDLYLHRGQRAHAYAWPQATIQVGLGMLTIRKASERGRANHGWLDTRHTFSFADYYDPDHMGFRGLRVINDDRVTGGKGFGAHPHRDMEILSYVLEGALAHKDSTGTGAVIRPGDVQRMSAGTGVVHSEFNASKTDTVHFLQIWLVPSARGIQPGYEQKTFGDDAKRGKLLLVASPDGAAGSITIHTDARVYAGVFGTGEHAELALAPARGAWVHVARGKISVNGQALGEGDGAAIEGDANLRIEGIDGGEVLVFDLA